jgi:SPX domain protein involved in polyphosphate accumulation
LIKELPSLVPNDQNDSSLQQNNLSHTREERDDDSNINNNDDVNRNNNATTRTTTEDLASTSSQSQHQHQHVESMGKSPGEVAFFKLLHSEFRKATYFFDRATEEFTIREERVREGMEIMKQPNSIMVDGKWSLLAKSIYQLYKDLLLLETFAIMTYCSFSKILKKHDKVTGYETRSAFMEKVVNKANFTHYPKVLEMITRCERLYDEVSRNLLREGKQGLYEDERTCTISVMMVFCFGFSFVLS